MQVVLGSAKADPVDPGWEVSLQFSRKRNVMPDVLVSSYLGLVNSDTCLVRFRWSPWNPVDPTLFL